MRWIDGLSKAQRVVVVIALGLALGTVGSYLVSLGSGHYGFGWTGYAPLTTEGEFFTLGGGLHPWVRLIIWLALIVVWAGGSVRVLRPSEKAASD